MKCEKCGKELNENATFCGNCGEPVPQPKKFCGKCGSEVDANAPFCGKCGNPMQPTVMQQPMMQQQMMMQPVQTIDLQEVLSNFMAKVKKFVYRFRYVEIAILVIVALGVGGYVAYQHLHDFTKLSWQESFGDFDVKYTTASQIELKAQALDKKDEPIKDIKYTVTGGEVKIEDEVAIWVLPAEAGVYTITAESPSGKKITKDIYVIGSNNENDSNLLLNAPELDPEGDEDGDGLTNAKEAELETDPYSADTDGDGLLDSDEVERKTDPIEPDTDGDGLLDGAEVILGADPLNEDTNGDGKKDGEESYTTVLNKNNIKLNLSGVGNITQTDIDVYNNTTLINTKGVLGKMYEYQPAQNLASAEITIPYDIEEITSNDLTESNLTVYEFDIHNKALTPIETQLNTTEKTLTISETDEARFVIGDKDEVNLSSETNILFVIDDSISMYTEEQMVALGYDESTGAVGNDSEFKRVALSKQLVEKLKGDYRFGVSEFSGEYYSYNSFTDNKTVIQDSLDQIHDMEHNEDGTDIVNALQEGIGEFSSDGNSNYLILLTDGIDTSGNLSYRKDSIIESAKDNNVTVCVIGLGDVDTDYLTDIAKETGCGFYYAASASVLNDVYAQLTTDINYGLVDIDGDEQVDGTVIYDSGFITTRDGFAFKNYASSQSVGYGYGMAVFANYLYRDVLPYRLGTLVENGNTSTGYSFGYSSYFRDENNTLYNYELVELDPVLNYRNIKDYWDRVEDGTLKINDKYRNQLNNLGVKIVEQDDPTGGSTYSKIEVPVIDMSASALGDDNDDYGLVKAIDRLNLEQYNDQMISFDASPDEAYEYAAESLSRNNPIVLTFYGTPKKGASYMHSVNLLRIIVDNEDSNKFYFEVYDSNRPGTTHYLHVTRTKYNQGSIYYTAWKNEYQYTFEYPTYGDKITGVRLSYLDY